MNIVYFYIKLQVTVPLESLLRHPIFIFERFKIKMQTYFNVGNLLSMVKTAKNTAHTI